MIKFSKIEGDPRKYFSGLRELFKHNSDVILAYIFGSYATAQINPLSDVDIAVLLSSSVSEAKYFDNTLTLIREISKVLRTSEIDLIILNEAPPVLAYQIIARGMILYCLNEKERIRLETDIANRYLDTKRLRREYGHYLFKQIKEGNLSDRSGQGKYRDSLREAQKMFSQARATE